MNNQLNPILDGKKMVLIWRKMKMRMRKKWSQRREMILSLTSIVIMMRIRSLGTSGNTRCIIASYVMDL